MKRSYLLSGLGALIVLGGIGTFIYTGGLPTEKTSTQVSAVVPQGQQSVYRLSYLLDQKPSNIDSVTPYRIEGKFVIHSNPAGDLVSEWGELSEFKILGVPASPDILSAMIGKPLVTRKTSEGDLEHFIGEDFPGRFLGLQISLLDKIFIPNSSYQSDSVTRRERDEFGQYNVQYSYAQSADGQGYTVTRKWLQSTDNLSVIDANASRFQYTYAENGQLQKVNGQLRINYKGPNGAVDVYTTQFTMELDSNDPLPDQKLSLTTRDLPKADLIRAEIASRTALADSEEGLPTIENIQQALERVDTFTADSPGSEQQEIFQTIKFGVMSNPGEAQKVFDKILSLKEDEVSEARSALLFGALTATSLPEVADTFADLAQNDCPNKLCRVQAITSLNIHNHPSASNGKTLLSIAQTSQEEDIVSMAYLAAGSVASKANGDIPEVTQALLKDVQTTNDDRKVSIIQAMGNHGNAEYYPVLEAEAKSENTFERSSALYSLRNIPVDSATQVLISSLNVDDSDIVNVHALRALAQKPLSAPDQVKVAEAFVKSTDKNVQAALTDMLLANYRANTEGATEAIAAFKEKSSDSDLKAYLDEAVEDIKRDKEKDHLYR